MKILDILSNRSLAKNTFCLTVIVKILGTLNTFFLVHPFLTRETIESLFDMLV